MRNIKLRTSMMALLMELTLSANAQLQKRNELHLYGSVGAKFLQAKSFSYASNVSPTAASIIGGGALWQQTGMQYGAEFFFTNATGHLSGYRSAYSGVNASLIAGYQFQLDKRFKLSVQSGLGYSLNHMYITDEQHLNTAIFHNYNYTIPLSVMLQWVNDNGTFIGIKAGHHFIVSPNHWTYRDGATTHQYHTPTDGLFLQLIAGGFLKLR
jgi:hypothetical protein